MAASKATTDEVIAAARAEVQAQLQVVREELTRVTAEEKALAKALSGLAGKAPAARPSTPAAGRKRGPGRRRRKRGASKPTAERVEELRGLLAEGPKSRNELAAALQVSAPRVQQLLAELGGSVSSQPHPERAQVKLWTLKGSANGSSGRKSKGGSA
jgi:type VI protein secretion system component VasK